jgi:hypothetical protein
LCTIVVLLSRRTAVSARKLLLAIAAGGPLALLILSAFGVKLMLTRYASFAVPFGVVVMAVAVAELESVRRGLGAALAVALVAASLVPVIESHRPSGFYLDARGVADYLRAHERSGDSVIGPTDPAAQVPLIYYRAGAAWAGSSQATRELAAHSGRLWFITELPSKPPSAAALLAGLAPTARAVGYRTISDRVFAGTIPLGVVLEVPLRRDRADSALGVEGGLHRRA